MVGINGYGRIGRNILRALYESKRNKEIEIVAINDLGDANTNAHLTQYDTAHGKFPGSVAVENDNMLVNGDKIRVLSERDPSKLPCKDLGDDVVHESTVFFTSKAKAKAHINGGAKKVIISAPGGNDVAATVVYGVNDDVLQKDHTIISNASCTTNCLAPLIKPLHESIGVKHGLMTTIHSYTNDQVLSDIYHPDPRRGSAAAMSQIPTKTGATKGLGLVIPELDGRLDGFAMRVPTLNVSSVVLSFVAQRNTSVEEINEVMYKASNNNLTGVLDYCDEPLVSIDFNHNPASAIYDSTLTKVMQGSLVKAIAWYDNEWGFSCRMLDTTLALINAR